MKMSFLTSEIDSDKVLMSDLPRVLDGIAQFPVIEISYGFYAGAAQTQFERKCISHTLSDDRLVYFDLEMGSVYCEAPKGLFYEYHSLRETSGGSGDAINRHSVRYFGLGSDLFVLDKTLNASPPFYRLSKNSLLAEFNEGVLSVRVSDGSCPIKVDGNYYWGDGLSWEKAIAAAKTAILGEAVHVAAEDVSPGI